MRIREEEGNLTLGIIYISHLILWNLQVECEICQKFYGETHN